MYTLLAQLSRFLDLPATDTADDGVAHALMEGAEAVAGLDPHHAQELRQAAQAWLSVVR